MLKIIGEVVPAREGLRHLYRNLLVNHNHKSEKWFQQEKD